MGSWQLIWLGSNQARAEIEAYLHNFIWDFFGITFNGSSVEHLNSLRKWIERFNECCT